MNLFLPIILACSASKPDTFTAGGDTIVEPPVDNDSDTPNNVDTDTAADSAEEGQGEAPVIRDIVAFFSNTAEGAPSVDVSVTIDDSDGDILNGSVEATLFSTAGEEEYVIPIDGNEAEMLMGKLVFVLMENIDNEIEYTLTLVVTDEAGNASMPDSTDITP